MSASTILSRGSRWLALSALLLAASCCQTAYGEPMSETVPVGGAVGPGLPPIDIVRPNFFDLVHQKKLTFDGLAFQPNLLPADLIITFDWLNPFTGGIEFSPPIPLPVIPDPTGAPTPVMAMWTIPFCPQEVSLHITATNVVEFHGFFTHECIIPEPGSVSLLALGGLALVPVGLRWRRRG